MIEAAPVSRSRRWSERRTGQRHRPARSRSPTSIPTPCSTRSRSRRERSHRIVHDERVLPGRAPHPGDLRGWQRRGIVGEPLRRVCSPSSLTTSRPKEGIAVPGLQSTRRPSASAPSPSRCRSHPSRSNCGRTDGIHWASFPYSTTHDWSIIDRRPEARMPMARTPSTPKYLDRAGTGQERDLRHDAPIVACRWSSRGNRHRRRDACCRAGSRTVRGRALSSTQRHRTRTRSSVRGRRRVRRCRRRRRARDVGEGWVAVPIGTAARDRQGGQRQGRAAGATVSVAVEARRSWRDDGGTSATPWSSRSGMSHLRTLLPAPRRCSR